MLPIAPQWRSLVASQVLKNDHVGTFETNLLIALKQAELFGDCWSTFCHIRGGIGRIEICRIACQIRHPKGWGCSW